MRPPVELLLGKIARDGFRCVLERAARLHGVSAGDVVGDARTAASTAARHELFWTLRHTFGLSDGQIGALTGRDRTTVHQVLADREAALQRDLRPAVERMLLARLHGATP